MSYSDSQSETIVYSYPAIYPFGNAIFAKETILFGGDAYADSYNSLDGTYGVGNLNAKGNIRVDGNSSGFFPGYPAKIGRAHV